MASAPRCSYLKERLDVGLDRVGLSRVGGVGDLEQALQLRLVGVERSNRCFVQDLIPEVVSPQLWYLRDKFNDRTRRNRDRGLCRVGSQQSSEPWGSRGCANQS